MNSLDLNSRFAQSHPIIKTLIDKHGWSFFVDEWVNHHNGNDEADYFAVVPEFPDHPFSVDNGDMRNEVTAMARKDFIIKVQKLTDERDVAINEINEDFNQKWDVARAEYHKTVHSTEWSDAKPVQCEFDFSNNSKVTK